MAGVLSIGSSVIQTFKADISDHKRKVRELKGENKKAAEEALKDAQRQNASLERQIKTLGKVAVAVGAVVAAWKTAASSIRAFQEDSQLRIAAAGTDIAALRTATQGLVSDLDLLKFSAAVMNTEFAITGEQMQQVQRFALILRRQGNDLTKVQEALTKALVEGNARGLRQFGVHIDEAKRGAEAHAAILEEIRKQTQGFTGDLSIAGDGAAKASVAWSNAWREMKVAVGALVEALSPVVTILTDIISLAARAIRLVTDLLPAARRAAIEQEIQGHRRAHQERVALFETEQERIDFWIEKRQEVIAEIDRATAGFNSAQEEVWRRQSKEYAVFLGRLTDIGRELEAAKERQREQVALVNREWVLRQAIAGLQGLRGHFRSTPMEFGEDEGMVVDRGERARRRAAAASAAEEERRRRQEMLDQLLAFQEDLDNAEIAAHEARLARLHAESIARARAAREWQAMRENAELAVAASERTLLEMEGGRQDTFLSRIFGAKEEFDAYITLWRSLSNVVLDAYEAMIDGTAGLGEAVKRATAGVLRSLGVELAVKALRAAGEGFMALTNPLTASRAGPAFAASAKYAAGAALAGVGAGALSGGGGGGGAAVAASSSNLGGGARGATSGGGNNITIIMGNDFADQSPRERQRQLSRAIHRSRRVDEGTSVRWE